MALIPNIATNLHGCTEENAIVPSPLDVASYASNALTTEPAEANSDLMSSPQSNISNPATLLHLVKFLIPDFDPDSFKKLLSWPADVFAVAGYILHKTGAYRAAAAESFWLKHSDENATSLCGIGIKWRRSLAQEIKLGIPILAPPELQGWWDLLVNALSIPVIDLRDNWNTPEYHPLVGALLNLVACSDAASVGLGLPHSGNDPAVDVSVRACIALQSSADTLGISTLCEIVDPISVAVLPKIHTPQVGFTFRSLTHHLALWPCDEVKPFWYPEIHSQLTSREQGYLNLLLIPYPLSLSSDYFKVNADHTSRRDGALQDSFRFDYDAPCSLLWIQKEFPKIIRAAKNAARHNKIDGIVLPELAFISEDEFDEAYEIILTECPGAFLIAGVSSKTDSTAGNTAGSNVAYTAVPVQHKAPPTSPQSNGGPQGAIWTFGRKQAKHHRWLIDRSQMQRYGFDTSSFEEAHCYAENTDIKSREINFYPLKRSLTICTLVCEDLARQEPASRLLRAVGPHLVVALLMDGPQLSSRWSARYAGVLAEDPGSSVITLTSRGMVFLDHEISQRPIPDEGLCIGLWRDVEMTQALPLHLPDGAKALLISPKANPKMEYSADGRGHKVAALTLAQSDILPIFLPNPVPISTPK